MFRTAVNKGGFENCGYMHGVSCISIVESPERNDDDKRSLLVEEKVMAMEKIDEKPLKKTCSSSSTSSIGKNSDVSGNSMDNSDDNEEVQSSYKSPLHSMEALEEVLPIRRGISRFYNGKSKSFASLADAASIKHLAKPENAIAKRRRNLLACNLALDKNRNNFQLRRSNGGGISKRVTNSSRNTLALAVAMNSSASNSRDSSSPLHSRFHPRFAELDGAESGSPRGNFSVWRSFSLADLHD